MSKKNLILGGVLIALIVFAYLYQGPLRKWQEGMGSKKNFFAKIDADKISKIEVIKSGKTTTLEREGNKLKVSGTKGFYVDGRTAEIILTNLKEASTAEFELVSSNKDKKEEFMVGEGGALVKLFTGDKEMVSFIAGKNSSDFVNTYVSKENSDDTYSVKVSLAVFNQDEWRDATIFQSDSEKITKIRFQYPTREFTVEKKDGKWAGTLPYKFKVDEEKIKKIASLMSVLNSVKIPEQKFEGTGLEKNNIIVQATGEGVDNTLMIGDNNGEDYYYALRVGSDNIYLINKAQRDELDKKISDLK